MLADPVLVLVGPVVVDEVLRLARVALEVVELPLAGLAVPDELRAVGPERELVVLVAPGLAEHRRVLAGADGVERRTPAVSFGYLDPGEVTHRRGDVEQLELLGPVAGRVARADAVRAVHHERHVQYLVVERRVVAEPAVFEELLPVVGGDDDRRVVHADRRLDRLEQPPDLGVRVSDLGVVQVAERLELLVGEFPRLLQHLPAAPDGPPLAEVERQPEVGRRPLVGDVRVVGVHVVHPAEDIPAPAPVPLPAPVAVEPPEPVDGLVGDRLRVPVGAADVHPGLLLGRVVQPLEGPVDGAVVVEVQLHPGPEPAQRRRVGLRVVEVVEPAVVAVLRGEPEVRVERGGPVSPRRDRRADGGAVLREVLEPAVLQRVRRGDDGRERRPRPRRVRVRVERQPSRREIVDDRRGVPVVAEASEVVGPEGVDREEDHV